MEISRKSVVIASSIIALAGLGFVAYSLLNEQSEEGGAWFNSSWMYRRSLTVENTGTTLTNEDVLVEFDTATLVTNSKLQSDCDDLRFVDSDDSTLLKYWIEGECNTTNTQIWVQIPSLPNGGKTIYVYYGNDTATSAEETWSGDFILLSDTSCPTGWSQDTAFNDRFMYGATTAGTDYTPTLSTHNHGGSKSITTGGPSTTVPPRDPGAGGSSGSSSTHTHTASIPIANATVLPPYMDMYVCTNSRLNLETNLVTLFDSETLPTGWTQFSGLTNRFPRGGTYSGTGAGTSTHTHTVSNATSSGASATLSLNTGFVNYNVQNITQAHTHTIYPTCGSANHIPPYRQMVYAEVTSSTYDYGNLVSMFSDDPPLGWTYFSSLEDKFGYGVSTFGTRDGGTSTHTHSITTTSSTPSSNRDIDGGSSAVARGNHTHTGSGTTSAESNIPSYRTVIFYQRKSSVSVTDTNTPPVEEMYNQTPNAPSSLLTEGSTNPTGITDLTPEFSAVYTDPDTGDTATHYQVQVNTSSDFTGTSMWDSTKTLFGTALDINDRSPDISYNGSTLQWSSTYYWRIKFWDNNDFNNEGPWSTGGQFTTNYKPNQPSTPYTSGSANPVKTTLTPTFSAIFSDTDAPDTGDSYQIQVNTSSDFTGTSMWDSTKTAFSPVINNNTRSSNITYNGSSLVAGTQYFWRIMFWDNNDLESIWSTTSNFITAGPPQNPSALLTEGRTNPVTIVAGYPNFSAFYTDPNGDSATYYEIEINSSATFTGTVMWDTGKTATSITSNTRSPDYTYDGVPLTDTNNVYYWRIRFWDSDDTVSDWSSTAQFTDKFTHLIIDGLQLKGVKIN